MKIKQNLILSIIIIASFFNSFIIQQLSLFGAFLLYILQNKKFNFNQPIIFLLLFIFIAFISFVYNFFVNGIDAYTFIFWCISYTPPILLAILVYNYKVRFEQIWKLFSLLIVLEIVTIFIQAIEHKTLLLRDFAKGTVGDANLVSFYIYIMIFYLISIYISPNIKLSNKNKFYIICLSIFLFSVTLMAESTAMTGFFIITMFFISFKYIKIFFSKITYKRILLFAISSLIIIFSIYNFTSHQSKMGGAISRINGTIKLIDRSTFEEILESPFLFKIKAYYIILSGKIFNDVNIFLGSGPATFTSRTSFMRIPDLRTNTLPIPVPLYESPIVTKYVRPEEEILKTASYGNLATMKTSIVSIIVETGILGFAFFSLFFYSILKRLNKLIKFDKDNEYIYFFGKIITYYFIMLLFYLNIWEYHLITFIYIILIISILNISKLRNFNESILHYSNL